MSYIIEIKCVFCGKTHSVILNDNQKDRYLNYLNDKAINIQDILPDLTADERELLVSHICGKCFDDTFK